MARRGALLLLGEEFVVGAPAAALEVVLLLPRGDEGVVLGEEEETLLRCSPCCAERAPPKRGRGQCGHGGGKEAPDGDR